METINEWLNENKDKISYRLSLELKSAQKDFNFMNDLSVVKLYRSRRMGVKSIIDFLKVYPELKNEIGFICTESLKYYIKTHKYGL